MYYHVKLTDSAKNWYQKINMSHQMIIDKVLVPFISGQVVDWGFKESRVLLNMKTINQLRVFKSKEQMDDKPGSQIDFDTAADYEDCTTELLDQVRQLQASPKTSSLLEKAFATPQNQVFVVMKFGDKYLDSPYQGVIKPAFHKYDIKCLRIDEVQDAGNVTDQVLNAIASSRYVLAELSGERPNCYYETGFAHALGKELILAIRASEDIHFDLAGYRFMVWETEQQLRDQLDTRLSSLVDQGANEASL